jgi:nicotinamidase-related amidase
VELCGLVSNICVLSNAVIAKAALPEAEIVVDARLTASGDPALHEKALDVLEGLQVTVLNRVPNRKESVL